MAVYKAVSRLRCAYIRVCNTVINVVNVTHDTATLLVIFLITIFIATTFEIGKQKLHL